MGVEKSPQIDRRILRKINSVSRLRRYFFTHGNMLTFCHKNSSYQTISFFSFIKMIGGLVTNIPIEKWGRDHWSLVAYLDCRCADNNGTINGAHLRHHPKRPARIGSDMAGRATSRNWKPEYDTRIAGFYDPSKTEPRQLADHDDIDCLEDIEKAGIIENHGSGLFPLIKFTEMGHVVANHLREHKRDGGNFATFEKALAVKVAKKSEEE